MIDRYTKLVLTVIASALLYLCIILTPLPGVQAQTAKRPGDPTGPAEAVIVGWRLPAGETVPVSFTRPQPVTMNGTVRVSGSVTTERSAGAVDRMVLVGWEEGGTRERPGRLQPINTTTAPGLPVVIQQK